MCGDGIGFLDDAHVVVSSNGNSTVVNGAGNNLIDPALGARADGFHDLEALTVSIDTPYVPSAMRMVLFSEAVIASERSNPTFLASTSKAATNSTSLTW